MLALSISNGSSGSSASMSKRSFNVVCSNVTRERSLVVLELCEPRSSVGSTEVRIDEGSRLGLGAGHELPVEVVRRLDRRVTHVGGDGLRVHAGGDQCRGE